MTTRARAIDAHPMRIAKYRLMANPSFHAKLDYSKEIICVPPNSGQLKMEQENQIIFGFWPLILWLFWNLKGSWGSW